jgi:hypothetical protein
MSEANNDSRTEPMLGQHHLNLPTTPLEVEPSSTSWATSPRNNNYGAVPGSPLNTSTGDRGFANDDTGAMKAAEATSEEAFPPSKLDIEEAMELLGMGAFQFKILVAAVRIHTNIRKKKNDVRSSG